MSHPYQHIHRSEKLIAAFGEWPTFHDAEIVKFAMERALESKADDSSVRLVMHIRQHVSIDEGTPNYRIMMTKNMLASFVCVSISDLELFDFNHQNVIDSFTVTSIQTNGKSNLLVEIESIWGLGGSFKCSAVALESVDILPIN